MKRLIRKSSFNVNEFLIRLINYNSYSSNEIEEVISNNPDCAYAGDGYRILFFDMIDFKEAEKERKKNNGQPFWGAIDNIVRVDGNYQSFSKTQSGVEAVTNNFSDNEEYGDLKIVIKLPINGLDIKKIFEKYQNELHSDVILTFHEHAGEEEVLAKFDSNDYEIVNIDELIEIYYKM